VSGVDIRIRPGANAKRLLAIALSILTVFFIVLSSSHFHADGHSDTTCPICQAAHIGVSPALAIAQLPAPLVHRAEPPAFVPSVHIEQSLSSAASRAPPSA